MITTDDIKKQLKIKNGILLDIISDAEFIEGVNWGKPRRGHPEGNVFSHIKEIFKNINNYYVDCDEKFINDLKILALIHDTFKYKVDTSQRKVGNNHYGYFAMLFAKKLNLPKYICKILLKHDDAYNAYVRKDADKLTELVDSLGNYYDLYDSFYNCDVHTGDKNTKSYTWFLDVSELYREEMKMIDI